MFGPSPQQTSLLCVDGQSLAKASRNCAASARGQKCQRASADRWQLRFMWTFKQNTQCRISLTNRYDHHFSSSYPLTPPFPFPSHKLLSHLPPSGRIDPGGWNDINRPDRVIWPPLPLPTLPPPHFWHINKICGLFVSIHCGVCRPFFFFFGDYGAHTELLVDKRELWIGWLPSLTVSQAPYKIPWTFRHMHLLEWRSRILKNGIRK